MAPRLVLIFEEIFQVCIPDLTSYVQPREQRTVLLQHFQLCLVFRNHPLVWGAEYSEIILLERVCNRLASVNESLFEGQIELFLSNLSCIANSSDYSIIHDTLSMDRHQVFTFFQKRVAKFFK